MEIKDLSLIDLVIAPSDLHGAILSYKTKSPQLNFKLLSKEDILEEQFGRTADASIGFLIKKYDFSFENALTIKRFINYGDISSKYQKIKYLGELKESLKSAGLFEKSEYFAYELSQKRVLVIGYDEDIELLNILKPLAKSVEVFPFVVGNLRPSVIGFKSINDEVFYIFNAVCQQIEEGIRIEDILIIAKGEEYEMAINKMCSFFNLPSAVDVKTPLFALESIQDELRTINQDSLEDYIAANPTSQIVRLINKYGLTVLKNTSCIKTINEILKRETQVVKGLLNLKITTSLPLVNQYKKVYLLGFNQGNYPVVKKDDEYLSDELKLTLNMQSSKEISKANKMRIIDFITNQKDLVITSKTNAKNTSYYLSSLIQELQLRVLESQPQEKVYSKKYLELVLASQKDLERVYGEITKPLLMYQKALDIPYNTYNYRFSGIAQKISNKQRRYSYSRIKTFFECQFAYYCKQVLQIDSFESSFATNFGSLAHKILEHVYDKDFDFESTFARFVGDYEFSESEKIILDRRKEDIFYVSKILKEHYQIMKVKQVFSENKYTINLNEEVSVFGIIDRIIITTDGNKDYFTIIDYKSGEEKIDLNLVQFGYSMQFPIYLLLLSEEYELENFLGLYIQPVTLNKIGIPLEERLEYYKKHIKLQGFSSDNQSALATFDPNFSNSCYIKSMRVKNDGTFDSRAKVINNEQIKNVVELVKEQIISADKKIGENEFEINPKIINRAEACTYCPFGDVCFKDEHAFVYLNTSEGGEEDVD